MGYAGGGVNGSLRWKDLGLDLLLPIDEAREEAEKAAAARKIASGAAHPVQAPVPGAAPPPQQQQAANAATPAEDEEGGEEDEDDEGGTDEEDVPEDDEEVEGSEEEEE